MQIYLNDLDISADYMDRLIEEMLANLPQVFLEKEMPRVKEELDTLNELSNRFRSSSRVCTDEHMAVLSLTFRMDWNSCLISLPNPAYEVCSTIVIAMSRTT